MLVELGLSSLLWRTAGTLPPTLPPGGCDLQSQGLGKGTSAWQWVHLGCTEVGEAYQPHTLFILKSESMRACEESSQCPGRDGPASELDAVTSPTGPATDWPGT